MSNWLVYLILAANVILLLPAVAMFLSVAMSDYTTAKRSKRMNHYINNDCLDMECTVRVPHSWRDCTNGDKRSV